MPPCDAQRPSQPTPCPCPPLSEELDRLHADIVLAGVEQGLRADGERPREPWLLDPRLRAADLRATARQVQRALLQQPLPDGAGGRADPDG